MNGMTKDQLRFATASGAVSKASIKSTGEEFEIVVQTTNGSTAPVVSARHKTPRTFTNPANALSFLHSVGITAGEFSTEDWTPRPQVRHATARHLSDDDLENILQQAVRADNAPSMPSPLTVDVAGIAAGFRRG